MKEWTSYAHEAGGIDIRSFNDCMAAGPSANEDVERDKAAGHKLNVLGTPTILVNGVKVTGDISAEHLDRFVRSALRNGSER